MWFWPLYSVMQPTTREKGLNYTRTHGRCHSHGFENAGSFGICKLIFGNPENRWVSGEISDRACRLQAGRPDGWGAFKQGAGMTRKHGTCGLNRLPPGEFPTPLFEVVANGITIRGSFVGTRQDMAEALAFAAAGKVKAVSEWPPLSAINDVLARLEHGNVASSAVMDFGGS